MHGQHEETNVRESVREASRDQGLLHATIVTDGGPWATHDMPCAVRRDVPAVLDLNSSVFHPSWEAQADGWLLIRLRQSWLRSLLKWLCRDSRR